MEQRFIKAEHLLLVLVTIKAKQHNSTLAQFAAISNGANTTNRCTWRDAYRTTPHSCWRTPPLFLPLLPSVRPDLIERVRLRPDGLKEIKRTWGIGYKAMLQEVAPKRVAPAQQFGCIPRAGKGDA